MLLMMSDRFVGTSCASIRSSWNICAPADCHRQPQPTMHNRNTKPNIRTTSIPSFARPARCLCGQACQTLQTSRLARSPKPETLNPEPLLSSDLQFSPDGQWRFILKGSWDLVTRVIVRITILITTYNPN